MFRFRPELGNSLQGVTKVAIGSVKLNLSVTLLVDGHALFLVWKLNQNDGIILVVHLGSKFLRHEVGGIALP